MNNHSKMIIADILEREMKDIENGIAQHKKWIAIHKRHPETLADQTPEEYEKWAMGCIAKKQKRFDEIFKAYQEL